jgi:hypothetical protein
MTAPAADGGKINQTMIRGVDHFYSVKLIIFLALQSRGSSGGKVGRSASS